MVAHMLVFVYSTFICSFHGQQRYQYVVLPWGHILLRCGLAFTMMLYLQGNSEYVDKISSGPRFARSPDVLARASHEAELPGCGHCP